MNSPLWRSENKILPIVRQLWDDIAWDLGGLSYQDLEYRRVKNSYQLGRTLLHYTNKDYGVVIQTTHSKSTTHVVGLLPTEDENLYKGVSNQLRPSLRGLISVETIFAHLEPPTNTHSARYPFDGANLIAIPSVD
jgi:hypothetical protein